MAGCRSLCRQQKLRTHVCVAPLGWSYNGRLRWFASPCQRVSSLRSSECGSSFVHNGVYSLVTARSMSRQRLMCGDDSCSCAEWCSRTRQASITTLPSHLLNAERNVKIIGFKSNNIQSWRNYPQPVNDHTVPLIEENPQPMK